MIGSQSESRFFKIAASYNVNLFSFLCHQDTHFLFQVVNSTCTGTNSCLINHKEITELIVARLEVKDFDLYKTMGLFAMPVGCRDATKYLEIAYECIPAGGWYSFNTYFEKLREGY